TISMRTGRFSLSSSSREVCNCPPAPYPSTQRLTVAPAIPRSWQSCTMAEYSARPCHWSVLLTYTVTNFASVSIFMALPSTSGKHSASKSQGKKHADEPRAHPPCDIPPGHPPAAPPDQLKRSPQKGRKLCDPAAESRADQQVPVLVP